MNNKLFLRNIKIGLCVTAVIASAGMYCYVSKETKHIVHNIEHTAPITVESPDIVRPVSVSAKKQDNFKPRYAIIYSSEENLSIQSAVRFAVKISVPLGLTQEELKQNLSHAAWRLLKQKNADAVIIWAYRDDDKLRAGGFTAGKCTLAPFGDWSKAADGYSLDDMQAVFDFADVYSKDVHVYQIRGETQTRDKTPLYSDKAANPELLITYLKKGTKIVILEHYRDFTSYDFIDYYKVQGKQYTGWAEAKHILKPAKLANIRLLPKTNTDKKWYEGGNLHNVTVRKWRYASYSNKIATCADFVAVGIQQGLFKPSVNSNSLRQHAEALLLCIESYVNGSNRSTEVENSTIAEIAALASALLGWLK